MTKRRLPLGLILVAILQFVPPLVLPLSTLKSISPVIWGCIVALFALLGVSLLRRRSWSRIASIFLQGFNILVRVLSAMGHVLQGGKVGAPVDVWLVSTTLVSIALSVLILYYIDLPDIQVAMQQAA